MPGSQARPRRHRQLARSLSRTGILERHLEAAKFNQRHGRRSFHDGAGAGDRRAQISELLTSSGGGTSVSGWSAPWNSCSLRMRACKSTHPDVLRRVRSPDHRCVRARVVWDDATPRFVRRRGRGGDHRGEPCPGGILRSESTDERFVGLLSVVAHEVFHAAFGVYKDASPVWRQYYASNTSAFDQLLDLRQNEGVAYYLSLIQRTRGRLSPEWARTRAGRPFEQFNRNAEELLSPASHTPAGAGDHPPREHLRLLGELWLDRGNGGRAADRPDLRPRRRSVDHRDGPLAFFRVYLELMQRDGSAPAAVTRSCSAPSDDQRSSAPLVPTPPVPCGSRGLFVPSEHLYHRWWTSFSRISRQLVTVAAHGARAHKTGRR